MDRFFYTIEGLSVWVGRAFGWCILILTLSVSYEVFVGYVLNWPCNKTSPAGPVPCILHGMGVAVGTSQPVVHTLAPTLAHAQASNPNKEMVNNC